MDKIEKIAAFEFFVSKLIKLNTENIGTLDMDQVKQFNDQLSNYSMTRYMKLLYFVCLMDANGYKEKKEDPTKALLLTIFNNFVAYQRGPVEETIYNSRYDDDSFSLFFYNSNSRFELKKSPKSPNLTTDQTDIIGNAFESLSKLFVTSGDGQQQKSILSLGDTSLVDISHSLNPEVWNDAFYYNKNDGKISEIFLKEEGSLSTEIDLFLEKTTKQQNNSSLASQPQ